MLHQVNTDSQGRNIDPRVIILQSLSIGFMLCAVKTDTAHSANIAYLTLTLLFFCRMAEAFRFCALYIALYIIYVFIGTTGEYPILSVFSHFAYFVLRILPMAAMTVIMTKTMTSAQLVGACQKIGIHKNLIIPLAVALRFLPCLSREVGYIRDAMKMRGIYSGFTGIVRSPIKSLEYVTVPLLIRCVKITDELSISAIVRGIEYPGKRSMMNELQFGVGDLVYLTAVFAVNTGILILDNILAS